jgi:hypothetical protein
MHLIQYSTLFELKFFHNFYGSNSSKDFDVILSKDTTQTLSRFGLICKGTPDGLSVLYNEEKSRILANHRGLLKFSFGLKLRNRFFGNFTELSYGLSEEKYFFSNNFTTPFGVDEIAPDGQQLLIHDEEFVGQKDVRLYALSAKPLAQVLGEKEVRITSNEGQEIYSGSLKGHETVAEMLKAETEQYKVYLEGSGKTVNISRIPDEFGSCFSVIDIRMGDSPSRLFNSLRNSTFLVRFPNRRVKLNYFFLSEGKKNFSNALFFSGKDLIQTSPPERVTLANGQTALKVSPTNLLALKKNYNGLQLSAELAEATTELSSTNARKKVNLPTPEVEKIKGLRINESELYYSDMYVYI